MVGGDLGPLLLTEINRKVGQEGIHLDGLRVCGVLGQVKSRVCSWKIWGPWEVVNSLAGISFSEQLTELWQLEAGI